MEHFFVHKHCKLADVKGKECDFISILSVFLSQTPLEALQEQCNTTSATNGHVVLQLEHAQSLLLQFSEGLAEISPWLEETQTLVGQLSMSTISYEAFREQQDLLQVGEKNVTFLSLSLFCLASQRSPLRLHNLPPFSSRKMSPFVQM